MAGHWCCTVPITGLMVRRGRFDLATARGKYGELFCNPATRAATGLASSRRDYQSTVFLCHGGGVVPVGRVAAPGVAGHVGAGGCLGGGAAGGAAVGGRFVSR